MVDGQVLPFGWSSGGAQHSCARMMLRPPPRSPSSSCPDPSLATRTKQQYITGTPAAPLLSSLPFSGATGRWRHLARPLEPSLDTCASLPIKSLLEKYNAMTANVAMRVTPGKSGIHGIGMFARVPLRAGEWVIEYIGEIIRPSVLELREKICYDSTIGCGTYTFSLPHGDDDMCLDATKCGNGAQLLNHSCDPNCFSATKSIQFETHVENKVIILSRRDIAAGEELTYDYRFCGEAEMPCFCGAKICRGVVNEDTKDESPDVYMVPRREVEILSWDEAMKHMTDFGDDEEVWR